MTVLLKPNWVLHYNQGSENMECMVTHPTFILCALREVLATRPRKVIIGDAPVQGCDFNALTTPPWRQKIRDISTTPIEIVDFRSVVLRGLSLEKGFIEKRRDERSYVLFDLATESLLEPVSSLSGRFRVTGYDPREIAKTHRLGRHQYLICREAFEADAILSLPKLKTHKKTGISAALKNVVGLSGNKEHLPHHRVGGSFLGGDCYCGLHPLKRIAEFCLDRANRVIGTETYRLWARIASLFLNCQRKIGDSDIEGSWNGNDTAWRMALDLNRLLLFGRADGTIGRAPVRPVYSLTDAILAGQGEGPLASDPVYLGVVTFAHSSAFADLAHSYLMHFDWQKIPLIRSSFDNFRFPLTSSPPSICELYYRNCRVPLEEIAERLGRDFKPPRGWKDYIERAGARR
jgi:uncharacterized protein (DUF362 family)